MKSHYFLVSEEITLYREFMIFGIFPLFIAFTYSYAKFKKSDPVIGLLLNVFTGRLEKNVL